MNVSSTALNGHLHLRCALRADGVPYISEQSFGAPIHLSKSHLDEGCCIQSIVNPTAGFFDGDELKCVVHVEDGAKLVLSMPSSSRVYRSRAGKAAVVSQRFVVGNNSSLEWIPEPWIPHAGAQFEQRTIIELNSLASLLMFDWITPGRVAMGEIFAYERLRWELDILFDGKLIARERQELRPDNESLEALRAKFPAAHYVTVYAAGHFSQQWPAAALDALNAENIYLGHGPLGVGMHVVRALCQDGLSARRLVWALRRLLYSEAGFKPPSLGRLEYALE